MSWMQFGSHHYEIGSDTMPPGVTSRDVALSLAKINRFTGHSNVPYSVAQHSTHVSMLLDHDPVLALYGLLHDVAESVVQDLSHPMKQALGPDGLSKYKAIEHQAEKAIYGVLGVVHPMPAWIAKAVKKQDWVAVATEKRDLLPPCDRSWDMLVEPPSFSHIMPCPDWKHAAVVWHQRFEDLCKQCQNLPMPLEPMLMIAPPLKDANEDGA